MECKADDCTKAVPGDQSNRLYCSSECKVRQNWRNQNARRRGKGRPGRLPATRLERPCGSSGCETVIPASAHPLRLFCSPTCKKREEERNRRYGKYGAKVSDYDRLFMEQEGRCAVCGTTQPGREGITRFAFDHDHETNSPRGLLCYLCNVGLGSFRDDPALLQAAIRYLETHAPDAAINPGSGDHAVAVMPHREK